MCGIVGVLGNHEVAPTIVEGLRRLEYRGYDSAGIATVDAHGTLDRRRAVGKLVNLSDALVHDPLTGHSGIGHTRWATHGAPNTANAHPHRAGPVAVVHNGIIENFQALRAELGAKGIGFESDTDTETVAMLVQSYMAQGKTPQDAVRETLARLDGAFSGDGALSWDVHSHPAGEVVTHQHGDGQQGTFAFTPPAAGAYSVMWRNPGDAPVSILLQVSLQGEGALESTHPAWWH